MKLGSGFSVPIDGKDSGDHDIATFNHIKADLSCLWPPNPLDNIHQAMLLKSDGTPLDYTFVCLAGVTLILHDIDLIDGFQPRFRPNGRALGKEAEKTLVEGADKDFRNVVFAQIKGVYLMERKKHPLYRDSDLMLKERVLGGQD